MQAIAAPVMISRQKRDVARQLAGEFRDARRTFQRTRNPDRYIQLCETVTTGVRKGQIVLDEDFSLRAIFEAIVPDGKAIVEAWFQGTSLIANALFNEAAAVKSSDFSALMITALSGETMKGYDTIQLYQDDLVTTLDTTLQMERMIGINPLGDQAKVIAEADPYPLAGLSPQWVDTPPTEKRGFIVPVTKEAIMFDRTGQVRERAADTRMWMRVNKEKRIMAFVSDSSGANFRYMNNSYATYGTVSGGQLFDNLVTSNAFSDWRNLSTVALKRAAMRDPYTGEPIAIGDADTIVAPPAMGPRLRQFVGAKEIRYDTNAAAGTERMVTITNNPLGQYNVVISQYYRDQTGDDTTWLIGNFKRAFAYMQNWGITTDEAGPSSHLGFQNDIVFQAKVSERGAAAVLRPGEVIKCTA